MTLAEELERLAVGVPQRLQNTYPGLAATEPNALETITKAAAALRAQEWQPIETAPRDGTWVLLRGQNSVGVPMVPVVGAWRPAGAWKNGAVWVDSGTFKVLIDLTEWRPLPTPPTSDKGEGL